jgi:hypothetical protein
MTDVELCNLALDHLSVSNKISALNGASKEEKACNRWYTVIRDLVLRTFPWPFASAVAELVENETETHLQWKYVFDLPSDFLKARRVFVPGLARNAMPRLPFATFLNEAGTGYVLGCDTNLLALEYTRKFDTNDKLSLVPADCIDAISWKLATRLVKPLSLDASLIAEAEGMYKLSVATAFGSDVETFQPDQQPEADYIEARG